jgi:hypothetical protein
MTEPEVKRCFDCVHGYFGEQGVFCETFRELIDDEEYAAQNCPMWERRSAPAKGGTVTTPDSHKHVWLPADPAEPNRRQCSCGWPPRHHYSDDEIRAMGGK